jgi:hypothetical protein
MIAADEKTIAYPFAPVNIFLAAHAFLFASARRMVAVKSIGPGTC